MRKVILTTGGTGGHIFPSLAVAEELQAKFPHVSILFVGGEYGMEKNLVKKAGLDFKSLPVRGFLGKGFKALSAFPRLAASIWTARKILKDFRPDVIAGFGGYASFPTMLAGKFLGIPCLLHEQNAVAGASNKVLARLGVKVCVTLPETKGFPGAPVVTGNPVRNALQKIVKTQNRASNHLLVLGGSQGASALNKFMAETLPFFKKNSVEILHQCGKKDEPSLKKIYAAAFYDEANVTAFIDDMKEAYEWADLILCRSGASTIAEICVAGLPAVFVPFPAAIHDHQTYNAQILVKAGGGKLVSEKHLFDRETAPMILDLLMQKDVLKSMSEALLKLARPKAAENIVGILENLSAKKNSYETQNK